MAIVLCRTIIIFTVLLLFMRILGKRQMGEMEISELVVSVLIADMACLPLQDIGIPLINGLVSVVTLFCLELILSGATLRSVRLRRVVWGRPCFLIEKGKINQAEMRKNRFSPEELTEELRRQSILDLNSVDYAILETDGTLNVIPVPAQRPVTAAQMNVPAADSGYPYTVICQGKVMENNLRLCGRDARWLQQELRRRKLRSAGEVYFMTVDDAGRVYCAAKEEK